MMKNSNSTIKPGKNKHIHQSPMLEDYQMKLIDPTSPDIDIRHYLNGRLYSKPGNIVHQLFWESVYAWLLPTDFFVYNIESYFKKQYMYLVVSENTKKLGYYLFTRMSRFLTLEDYRNLEDDSYISQDSFRKRITEFNKLFSELPDVRRDLRPIKHDRDIGSDIPTTGYRMHPQRQYIMVVGIDPKVNVGNLQIDWPKFEIRPELS